VSFVTEHGCDNDFLAIIEESHSYLMSLARLTSEKRKDARDEQANENPAV
jgi:hypothetical protein